MGEFKEQFNLIEDNKIVFHSSLGIALKDNNELDIRLRLFSFKNSDDKIHSKGISYIYMNESQLRGFYRYLTDVMKYIKI